VRLTPDRDSTIILRYGHRDGYESASLNANVVIGGRTTLSARYSDQIGTALQRAGDLLSNTRLDEQGNIVDAATGGPVILPFSNSLLATQTSVMRNKRATVSLTQFWPRDSITLSLLFDDRQPITSAPGTTGFAQKGLSASLSWAHVLTERTTASAYFQIGRNEREGSGKSDIHTVRLRLSHNISLSLVGWMEYGFSNRSGDTGVGDTAQNLAIIGLRQFF
jgi:uncharacterized protein (PEP-CTERM system associated)